MDSFGGSVRSDALFGDNFNESLAQTMFTTLAPEIINAADRNISMYDWFMAKAEHFPIKISLIFSICKCAMTLFFHNINN